MFLASPHQSFLFPTIFDLRLMFKVFPSSLRIAVPNAVQAHKWSIVETEKAVSPREHLQRGTSIASYHFQYFPSKLGNSAELIGEVGTPAEFGPGSLPNSDFSEVLCMVSLIFFSLLLLSSLLIFLGLLRFFFLFISYFLFTSFPLSFLFSLFFSSFSYTTMYHQSLRILMCLVRVKGGIPPHR